MNDENPFAALLDDTKPETAKPRASTSAVLEEIFGFTLSQAAAKERGLVFLQELSEVFHEKELTVENLEHALFERLLLSEPQIFILSEAKEGVVEKEVLPFLFSCYCNLRDSEVNELEGETSSAVKSLIMRNVVTAITQRELYSDQDINQQLFDLIKSDYASKVDFLEDLNSAFLSEENDPQPSKSALNSFLDFVHEHIKKSNITTFDLGTFDVLSFFATHEYLAEIFISHSKPQAPIKYGSEYAKTLLGSLFNVSILPETAIAPYEFFTDVIDNTSRTSIEQAVWSRMADLAKNIHNLFHLLLKCNPAIRNQTLDWFGNCLQTNLDKGKLWNIHRHEFDPTTYTTVGDGFMINLTDVLLRLCRPICSEVRDGKILRVDPTYCAGEGMRLPGLAQETCLVPVDSDAARPKAKSFNFVTECFFMAHRAFDLGFRVAVDRLVELNQQLARIERTLSNAQNDLGGSSEVMESIRGRMKAEMAKYLSIKAALSEPSFLKMTFSFISNTCFWLTQLVLNTEIQDGITSYAPLKERVLELPLKVAVIELLRCIPEFVVENVICFLVFLRRWVPDVFEQEAYDHLEVILSFVLIFMGSNERTRNPHLRAKLAKVLEALLPFHKDETAVLNTLGVYQRTNLFKNYPFRKEIVCNLLNVFVQIEMTGQSVEFEQKFNYRRPMYIVLDYLWEIEEYQQYLLELAEEAEKNMEAVTPPLFLRFVNLLMNDAVFLLDEALTNMEKLREMQIARDNGEWDRLPTAERAQNQGFMQHTGMAARFGNILGKDTIGTLEHLTSKITIVFTHSTMVDRVAAMLNYFLYNLVGPKKKNFKVKDPEEYSFDPANTVLNIAKIYVNLGDSDAFCLAVSRDGRSYNPRLFSLAEDVLARIGGGPLLGELQEVATRVARLAAEQQADEEAIAEAPDHYLDPIMSTLMLDPVVLPSSRQTVDRSTIARHLLSDQTDPFNRAPLSMDQVVPNTQLAEEIRNWLEQRKRDKCDK